MSPNMHVQVENPSQGAFPLLVTYTHLNPPDQPVSVTLITFNVTLSF